MSGVQVPLPLPVQISVKIERFKNSKNLNFKIKLLTISGAEDRLTYYLTFNKGKITYKSITKLANELYLTRESLSRTITKMVKEKKITQIRKTLKLVV